MIARAAPGKEYNFKSIEGWNVNYRTLYSKVLRRYGDLVGFWRRDFQYYGGLLQIKKKMIAKKEKMYNGHVYFMWSKTKRHEYRWSPLELPSKDRVNVPIQPGLFKGTYSAHGIEILSLDYNDDLTEVTVTKITGDPNVPATKVSVYANLTSPLVLTIEQQESLDTLGAVPEHHVTEQSGPAVRQPFRIPEHFSDRDISDIPKFCIFRCRAKGQIAGHGFKNPSFSDAHFVVFDEWKFGMVWLDLMAFKYNFKSIEGWNVNYCILYNKVLRRYGDLVGFWRRDFQYYGGLLQIKFDKGCIKGLEVLPPAGSSVDRPLRKTEIFTISLTSSETVQIVSVHNFPEEEDGEEKDVQRPCLLHVEENERNKRILEYKVTDKKYILQKEDLNNHPVLKRWLDEDFLERGVDYLSSRHEYRWSPLELSSNSVSNVPIQPGLFKGSCFDRGIEIQRLFYTDDLRMLLDLNNHPVLKRWLDEDFLERGVDYLSSRHEYRWSPLELSSNSVSNVPIQPGLFKGACCLSGIEILSLYYTEDLRMLMVTNITGVQHTPARKFIIHGILGRPRVLTVEQQESEESEDILSAAHRHNENEHPDRPAAQQPFRIPKDCFHQDIPDIPKFCTFR
uniref:F-box only protein 31 n=1 Tax=Magallana gigas TaxID=29159 RepID=K1QH38_MAGGI